MLQSSLSPYVPSSLLPCPCCVIACKSRLHISCRLFVTGFARCLSPALLPVNPFLTGSTFFPWDPWVDAKHLATTYNGNRGVRTRVMTLPRLRVSITYSSCRDGRKIIMTVCMNVRVVPGFDVYLMLAASGRLTRVVVPLSRKLSSANVPTKRTRGRVQSSRPHRHSTTPLIWPSTLTSK
ncbi:hypothetical protein BC827DRAFT_497719 [Russula dissimulans]|nr:hypothetical protein BC827DRAFT_497719 [Russula dissimulans]